MATVYLSEDALSGRPVAAIFPATFPLGFLASETCHAYASE